MWKYYFLRKQFEAYKSQNDDMRGTPNPKCRTFAKGLEFTWATNSDNFPEEFDDYILVLGNDQELDTEDGEPY